MHSSQLLWLVVELCQYAVKLTSHLYTQKHTTQKMMRVVLVGFLPSDHGCSCEMHPYECRNELIEEEGDVVGRLICLCLVEKTHLAGYEIKDDGTEGCQVCFAA
jgi:hypothetical protein